MTAFEEKMIKDVTEITPKAGKELEIYLKGGIVCEAGLWEILEIIQIESQEVWQTKLDQVRRAERMKLSFPLWVRQIIS